MKPHLRAPSAALLLLALLAARPCCAAPTDDLLASLQPTADVNDYAEILTPQEEAALEQRCRQLREQTDAQLAVVTLKSLAGGQVDDFTVKLFKRWGVGQAEKNNGVMLLVAIEDRKARIEVGYGLEPILPDVLAGRILREQLFPAFRQERYAAGLTDAVNRIAAIIERGEPAPREDRSKFSDLGVLCLLPFFLVFTGFPSLLVGACLRAKQFIPLLMLSGFLGFGYFLAIGFAIPWWCYLLLAPFDVFAGYIGYGMESQGGRRSRRRTFDDGFFGGWSWGGSSTSSGGSSWSGGGFGGGSWGGFGGGMSGGGGASGGW